MKKFNIKNDKWYQDRRVWRTECKEGLKECTQEHWKMTEDVPQQ